MNLDASPDIAELRQLIAQGNDRASHHVLWVDKSGEVHISPVPADMTRTGFEQAHPEIQIRYETFQKGNEYVGPTAASNDEWVSLLFDQLLAEWSKMKGSPAPEYVELP